MKSPVGRAFFDYFGENLFRSDLSISVGELGSLLDHSGPIGESEKYTARVFGAHRTYHVTNGSSTSNRVIMTASVTRGQVALCDRNAHKSVEHAITMSGAVPTYMMPTRNQYGIIGPILPENLTPQAIRASIRANPLVKDGMDAAPVHAIVTNSTYDGLCYNVRRVEELLGRSVDRLHFDEAWYGYARFNPLYEDRYAMHGDPSEHTDDKPSVFATQSTHKLLAALSQASMIHVRDGRNPIEHNRFNEAFMMHASTSPQYAIIASNDVSAAMMDGPGGETLTGESIREAVAFRRLIARLNADYAEQGEWFVNGMAAGCRGRRIRQEGALLAGRPRPPGRRPRVLDPQARRKLARFRQGGGGILHARPHQGVGDHARRGRGRTAGMGHSGLGAHLLPGPLRHRGGKDHGFHHSVPVLPGDHQGQVGHFGGHAAALQKRLRRQYAPGRVSARPSLRVSPALPGHGPQGPVHRYVPYHEKFADHASFVGGLFHPAPAGYVPRGGV